MRPVLRFAQLEDTADAPIWGGETREPLPLHLEGEQQASVPRPWLGVKGEAVAALKLDQILNQGWEMKRAADLADKHRGIMLTKIVPGSPAEMAALRAGDVILKVNDKEIQNADDFTWWLDQAGPSRPVEFTVDRPDRMGDELLSITLSGRLDPMFSFDVRAENA